MNFSAVILAGGKSSRMGRDKARLPMEGQTLIERQIDLVRKLGAGEILISARKEGDHSDLGLPVITDQFVDAGPLGGIERALAICASPLLLVLAVDMPYLTVKTLAQLQADTMNDLGVIPRVAGQIEPLAAFYPKSAHELIGGLLSKQSRGATSLAEQCVQTGRARFHDLAAGHAREFSSWNTPAEVVS